MTDKQIIIDGLSCDNCAEFKRCQEQQTKKEYAINQVLQDIPSEYANIINRLKQIIPSITRCDYVLEKQLKRKEQECEELKKKIKYMEEYIKTVENSRNEFEKENKFFKEENKRLARVTQHKGQEYEKIKQTLDEIEKTFFDTFGIEPKLTFYDLVRLRETTNQEIGGRCSANWQGETKEETIRRFSPRGWKVLECKDVYTYPQITDRILLELICLNNIYLWETHTSTVNELKNVLLNKYIEHVNLMADENEKQEYINQVRALFEEGN